MFFDYDSLEQQLRLAAKQGNLDLIEDLLEQGAQIDAAPVSQMTAVRLALKYRQLAAARLLLHRGACVSLADANTLEELHFLQHCGVKEPTLEEIESLFVRAYEKGRLSWEEVEIRSGRRRDHSLIAHTTVEEVEAAGVFRTLDERWEKLKARMLSDDELWEFDNGLWDQLAGRRGYVLLRQNCQVLRIVILLN